MSRIVRIGAAQLGPIARDVSRSRVVERLVGLLEKAAAAKCDLVVYPELALTTFFPRWFMEDQRDVDMYFEFSMPSAETQPLFDAAKRLGVGFYLGYAEAVVENGQDRRFNTSILVGKDGDTIGKYRKIHLPGHTEPRPSDPFQHLEKRYFEVGDRGFPTWEAFGGTVGMCICNDRRWPETFRTLGLQGVELVLVGYNTPTHNPANPQPAEIREFHNLLCLQAGAYQNSTWVVGVAKAGKEEGVDMMAGTAIVAPDGTVRGKSATLGDELVVAECDLDECNAGKRTEFNFSENRRPEFYGAISERRC